MVSLALTVPLAQRIGHTDPSKFNTATAPHAGAGSMHYGPLLETEALSNNLIFVHRGVIPPKCGIGQHFHNQCEEMFIILDGEAEFTIDGRTSLLKGPVGVPDRMGHAHAIYNPTEKSVQWMNINVGMSKSYDAFDLGDSREGARLDAVPQFITMKLDKARLEPVERFGGGEGVVRYRRALNPTVFSTAWAYVDHLEIHQGAYVGPLALSDLTEVYYVMSGEGEITVDDQSAKIVAGDAIPVDLGQSRTIRAAGTTAIELMAIGVARDMPAKAALMSDAPSYKNSA